MLTRTIVSLAARRPLYASTSTALSHAVRQLSTLNADVAIVGGGVAGVALACALGQTPELEGQTIALIDANDLTARYTPADGDFSNRVVSLAPRSVAFLERIGAWERIPESRRHPYTSMKVWDACDSGAVTFDASEVGAPAVAYMVEIPMLRSALLDALTERAPHVHQLGGAPLAGPLVRDTEATDGYPVLPLANDASVVARLAVGADGAASAVRSQLMPGNAFFGHDYGAAGVVATLEIEAADNDTAWQRFLPTGPIALLPLGPHTASLVWSLPRDLAAKARDLPADEFAALVNAAFFYPPEEVEQLLRNELGLDVLEEIEWRDEVHENAVDLSNVILPPHVAGVADGSRAMFPLRVRHALEYTADRVALIGDAAHVIHPLAGQGLNLGLADAESLARVLREAAVDGSDLGHPHVLEKYPADRYAANAAMLSACDGLHHLFGTDNARVAWTRSFGLNAFNGWDAVKRFAMRFAMGKQ
ncbi:putative ubiquinone biosynthesis monooxygenase [Blastocladiella emersonii ATCC 22665]|nr:putative ubiquinone biosynthesis monooxygenase [Blastocladiella emersonii ATCC 22665]